MSISIRPATPADLPEVQSVLRETWHDTYDEILGAVNVADMTRRWHDLASLERETLDPQRVLLLSSVDGEIVGTASASRRAPPRLRLNRLYVRPVHQRRGHGRALLQAAIAAFPDRDVVELEVHARNARGLAFYDRLGFSADDDARAGLDPDTVHLIRSSATKNAADGGV